MLEISKLYTVIEFVIEFDSFRAVTLLVIHVALVYKTTYDQTTRFSCSALTLWVEWHEGHAAEKYSGFSSKSSLWEQTALKKSRNTVYV